MDVQRHHTSIKTITLIDVVHSLLGRPSWNHKAKASLSEFAWSFKEKQTDPEAEF